MAQIKFYFAEDEWRELFEYLYVTKSKLIPDIFYDDEHFHLITTFREFLQYQEHKTTHFFLINEIFSLEPLLVSLNKYTEGHKYRVDQRTGGPYLDISYYRGFAEDMVIPYKATYLSYYPKFIHFNSQNEMKASDELKDYYTDIVKFIKKRCKIVQKDNKKHLIGHEVFKEIGNIIIDGR
jgi:hypothetical protein